MDFHEFNLKVLNHSTNVNRCTFYKYPSGIYHLTLHKSRFEEFVLELDQNVTVLEHSVLWKNDHIHLLIYIKEKSKSLLNFKILPVKDARYMPFENRRYITRYLPFENSRYIHNNFITGGKERHDLVCNVSFKVLSLQIISMNIILRNLRFLHDIFKLNLPSVFYKKLFKQSQQYFSIPSYSDITHYNLNNHIFSENDTVFTKDFVSWIQRATLLIYRDIYYVHYQFISPDNTVYNLCLKCMNFEMGKDKFIKISQFRVIHSFDTFDVFSLYRNPLNWCHVCHQTPLFYIPTDPYLFLQSDFNNAKKIDYYEDGKIVRSIPRKSNRIKEKYKRMKC